MTGWNPDVHQLPSWDLPTGARGQTFARSVTPATNSTSALVTQQGQFVALWLPANTPVTSISFFSGGTPAGTPTNWFFALYDSASNVIRQSTDQLTAAWGANTVKTLNVDSIPTTAGARVASTTVTLTVPALSQSLTALVAVGDSVVVSNANIAAYNGTFTVSAVTSTTIAYTAGSLATDSLAAPFPTVQLAASTRLYSAATSTVYYLECSVKAGTVPSLQVASSTANVMGLAPIVAGRDTTNTLTGTAVSPATVGGNANQLWGYVS